MNMKSQLEALLNQSIETASNEDLYVALLKYTQEKTSTLKDNAGDRKLYYVSAEFLIGKLLSNNLINLGLYDDVKALFNEHGKCLSEVEEVELEPSLGNGGLGRLAACFLDSIATLGLNGDGIGLNYHYGLFKQVFTNNKQNEQPNPWINEHTWLKDTNLRFNVPFKNFEIKGKLYDLDIIGYNNGKNQLHLFDVETIDESIVTSGIDFDKTAIEKNLTLFLYPDDSDENGHLLRIYQQYFMVSCGAQYILQQLKNEGKEVRDLDKHVVIQINDTHPSLIIPELIRLMELEGITREDAAAILSRTCAYTNHTILSEALEKWPLHYLEEVTPNLVDIIHFLNDQVNAKYHDARVAIIDEQQRVHMARMDMHYGFSVNGVAAIHTEILKDSELNDFYRIYPEKFNNKTNGITFRRWLMHTNPELASYITSLIGDGWKKDACELEKLLAYVDNQDVLNKIVEIKQQRKHDLAHTLLEKQGIKLHEDSIISIQIKRLHEYKRQQMNALYIIYKYLQIKNGQLPKRPITMIFGAKAAPAYTIAKDIIHLLICLSKLIENDPIVSKYLQVIMVENYNVSYAEKLIPAADISEQISLASKEASGTGNMKFMLNGAITLGTLDGANVEISELVGENIFLFGENADQVIEHYNKQDYHSATIYNQDELIHTLVDFIVSKDVLAYGDHENLSRLHHELISKDWFMTLLDLNDYIKVKDQMIEAYEDQEHWKKMMLINIAKAGFFSSDRTIAQYNEDIWKL